MKFINDVLVNKELRTGLLIALAASAATLSGCALEQPSDTQNAQRGEEVEQIAATSQALTTPPAGSGGFTLIGNYRLKNGTGVCMVRSGSLVGTEPCSSSSNQVFAVYQAPDGDYNLCVPNSLTTGFVSYGDFGSEKAYVATCLERKDYTIDWGKTDMRFYSYVPLSEWNGSTYTAWPGRIHVESGVFLNWIDSDRRLTKNSGGAVVLGKMSGALDQQWSVILAP